MSIVPRRFALLIAAVSCVAFAGCSAANGQGGDVASVNGDKISRTDFDNKLEGSQAGKQTLNQMVQQKLVDQYGRDNHIDISDAEVDKKENEIKGRYPAGQFDAMLKQQGLTENDVRTILREQLIIEKSVGKDIHVSDTEIKAYFDKNRALLDKPEQVRARHILVADPKTAATVESKLKAGGDFAALAKQYSTDPGSKDKGGELGFFGKGQMVPAFQNYAFGAPVGKISQPVKSPFGYHIIQVEEKRPAQKATLASTRDQIKQQLTQQQQAQQVPVFLQQLRSKANVVVYDDRLKDALATPPPAGAAAGSAPANAPANAPAAASPAAKK